MTWNKIETVPLNQAVLIAWGTKSYGPMGYEVSVYDDEKWSETDTGAFVPLAWMPLPPLPDKNI